MSSLTTLILTGSAFPPLDNEFICYANEWLTENEHGELKQADIGGDRPYVGSVFVGCFNGLNLEQFLQHLSDFWHIRDNRDDNLLIILIRREHDDEPWLCTISKEGIKPYPLPPQVGL